MSVGVPGLGIFLFGCSTTSALFLLGKSFVGSESLLNRALERLTRASV